jgi:hypothetical protein
MTPNFFAAGAALAAIILLCTISGIKQFDGRIR